MKPTIIILALLFAGCAYTPDPWTKDQMLLQGVTSSLNIIDWGQTLDIVDNHEYYETNPILGEYPTRAEVNRYFAYSLGLQLLITHLLPSRYRNYWLGCNIMVSGYYVQNNYRIGLRVNF